MSEHVLEGGTRVRVRPMTAADGPALREAWSRLSMTSRRRRFFGAVTQLTDDMVRYLTTVDGKDHIALAAIVDSPDLKTERGIGVARCIRLKDEPEVAEAAVTVIDEMQGRGVGRLLVEELARAAYAAGIKRFRGEALEENVPLRSLLHDLGIVPTHTDEGTIVFDIDIQGAGHAPGSPLRRWLRAAVTSIGGAVNALPFVGSPGGTHGGHGSGEGI